MEIKSGVPQGTISLVTDVMWIIYEDGYVSYGELPDFDEGYVVERFSHLLDLLGGERYPQTEEEIAEVLVRSIE